MIPQVTENKVYRTDERIEASIFGENYLPLESQYGVNLSQHFGINNIPQAHNHFEIAQAVIDNNTLIKHIFGVNSLNIR